MTGDEFRRRREQLGESQESLATLLTATRRTVIRWEASKEVPARAAMALEQLQAQRTLPVMMTPLQQARLQYVNQDELSNAEAAEYLGIHRRTLLDNVTAGLIPKPTISARRVDGQNRQVRIYKKKDLDDYLARESMRQGRKIFPKKGARG